MNRGGEGYDIRRHFSYGSTPVIPPVASFTTNPSPATGNAPLTVAFTDTSTNSPTSWLWTITGGVVNVDYVYTIGSATSENPTIRFDTATTYGIALTATNTGGSNTSALQLIQIELGTIFSKDFATGATLDDFSIIGASTWVADGTKVTVTNSGGLFDQILTYNKDTYFSNLEKYNYTLFYNVGALNGYGLGIGVYGSFDFTCLLFLNTLPGLVRLYSTNGNIVLTDTGATTLPINANDNIKCELSIDKKTFYVKYTNLTTPGTIELTYNFETQYPFSQSAIFSPGYWKPALYSVGGTQTITKWSENSNAIVGADLIFIGDSITSRYYCSSVNASFPELVASGLNKTFNVYAGPGNNSSEAVANEIIELAPKKAVICLGTNDQIQGFFITTSMGYLATLRTALEGAGIEVVFCQIPPLDTVDVTAFNAALVLQEGARVKIDLFTLLKDPMGTGYATGKSPDGIHPASTQQSAIADLMIANI